MNINLNTHIDISGVIGVVIRKVLEFKKVDGFTDEEFKEFWEKLENDEEFLNAYKNIVKVGD
ncbi:MAG: hypothetical protein MST00_01310 [Tenericutes bacterium]|nr:hypothetical protein [Bacilli bacterium]MCI7554069.1 hypothetical protein [Mycoplasmatota bacterium]